MQSYKKNLIYTLSFWIFRVCNIAKMLRKMEISKMKIYISAYIYAITI